jgi:tetratricopeptide (TPR) repeat protein
MGLYFFRRAVEVNPYLRFNQLKLAVSLLQAGEATGNKAYVEEAIPEFKKVAQFSPDYFEAYYNLGVAYYYLKDFRKARFYFEKTLSLNKDEKDAWFLLGKVAEKEGKPKEALKFYERSLKVWEKEKRLKSKGEANWELEEKAKEAIFKLKREI